MSDEQDELKASLEPPRLFGRKKKSGSKGATKPARTSSRGKARKPAEPAPETPEAPGDEVDEPAAAPSVPETGGPASAEVTEPVDEAAPEAVEAVEDDPAVADTDETQVLEEQPAPEAESTHVIEDEPALQPEATKVIDDEPAPEPEADPAAEATEVVESDEEAVDVDEDDENDETSAEPVPDDPPHPSVGSRLAGRVRSRWGPKPTPVEDEKPAVPVTPAHGQIEVEPEPVSETEAEDADIAARGTPYTEPMLDHYPAAALTGALVGLAMVVLTWLSLRGCEAIRGTATCGGGPGLLLLLAVFIVSVMLGNAILKSFLVPDPASSSFLAVGLVAVVALLLLIDALDSWVMLIAIPLISIAAYLLSVYVTKTFVEPADDS